MSGAAVVDELEELRNQAMLRGGNLPFYRIRRIFNVEKTPEGCLDVMEWLFENGAVCLVDPLFHKADETYHSLMRWAIKNKGIEYDRYFEVDRRYWGLMEKLEGKRGEYLEMLFRDEELSESSC
jgi:hypothetical protein